MKRGDIAGFTLFSTPVIISVAIILAGILIVVFTSALGDPAEVVGSALAGGGISSLMATIGIRERLEGLIEILKESGLSPSFSEALTPDMLGHRYLYFRTFDRRGDPHSNLVELNWTFIAGERAAICRVTAGDGTGGEAPYQITLRIKRGRILLEISNLRHGATESDAVAILDGGVGADKIVGIMRAQGWGEQSLIGPAMLAMAPSFGTRSPLEPDQEQSFLTEWAQLYQVRMLVPRPYLTAHSAPGH